MKLYSMLVHVINDIKSKAYHPRQNLAPEIGKQFLTFYMCIADTFGFCMW